MSQPALCPGHDQPTAVAVGLQVCAWHQRRLAWAISAAPDVVAHIRDHIEPGQNSDAGTTRAHNAPPAPLNLAAIDDANAIHAELVSWCLVILEEHPDKLHPPSWAGTDIRPMAKGRTADGDIVYRDARAVGVNHPAATKTVARWLLTHLDWALAQPWAPDYADEVPTVVGQVRARWPIEDRDANLPVPCPHCGLRTLIRHAPRWAGAPMTIACTDCTAIYGEDQHEWLIRLARGIASA